MASVRSGCGDRREKLLSMRRQSSFSRCGIREQATLVYETDTHESRRGGTRTSGSGQQAKYGMHFGTFQLTTEAIDQPQADLKLALSESGIPENQFITLQEGETRSYPAD